MKFHKTYVCEEDQNAKPCQKPWIYQVLSLNYRDLLKTLAILSDATLRKSVVDREDLKPFWKSEKRLHFSR